MDARKLLGLDYVLKMEKGVKEEKNLEIAPSISLEGVGDVWLQLVQ